MSRASCVLTTLLLALPALASAQELPSQEEWAAARKTVETADGLALTYIETGADAPGEPLVLLHGYTDNSRSWSLLIPHLGDRHVYALDLRGHGGSEAPACCYGMDALSHDVLGAMDALGIERADLVGHSLGSMVAAVLAAEHPDRVDDLVLVSSALAMPAASTDWLWDNVPGLTAPIDPEGEFMLAWYWNPTPVDEDYLSRERAESAATPLPVWTGVLRSLSLVDWTWHAGRIQAPTLVLWGDQDSLFDAAAQDRLRAALPAADHETYDGLGHNMFWEAPEEVGARITAFLTE